MTQRTEKNPNRKTKDTLFTKLFEDVSNQKKLYEALFDGEEVKEEEIKLITLDHVFTRDFYNDLGLLIKDKLILLVESQSTFNPNMALRFLIYIAATYQDYILENAVHIYGTKKVTIPTPQFFLIYTGEKEFPDKLSLSSLYADSSDVSLELSVNVLSAKKEEANIVGQYIRFCKYFDTNKKNAKSRQDLLEALRRTIDYCIGNDILKDFLLHHRKEAMDFEVSIFTEEQLRALERQEDFEEGLERGRIEGKLEGKLENCLEVAKKMKRRGFPLKAIAEITDLSFEEIKNL